MGRSRTIAGRIARGLVMVPAAVAVLAMATAASWKTAAFAQDAAPPIPKEVRILDAVQLKKMLDGKEKFLLVDARNEREYKEGHIVKAVHVYDKDMEAHKAKFPAEKSYPIVFYCNGYPKCVRSLNGARMALGWGYTRVSLYVGGFPDWEAKGYPAERE
jgi:rhodanese-related sulfurtransferase